MKEIKFKGPADLAAQIYRLWARDYKSIEHESMHSALKYCLDDLVMNDRFGELGPLLDESGSVNFIRGANWFIERKRPGVVSDTFRNHPGAEYCVGVDGAVKGLASNDTIYQKLTFNDIVAFCAMRVLFDDPSAFDAMAVVLRKVGEFENLSRAMFGAVGAKSPSGNER